MASYTMGICSFKYIMYFSHRNWWKQESIDWELYSYWLTFIVLEGAMQRKKEVITSHTHSVTWDLQWFPWQDVPTDAIMAWKIIGVKIYFLIGFKMKLKSAIIIKQRTHP